ncbi:Coiled-coil domain-containing protein [Dirofilaria immitis]|nr:Coiled-coil domain-containing protein [Dirofilaria immitis]
MDLRLRDEDPKKRKILHMQTIEEMIQRIYLRILHDKKYDDIQLVDFSMLSSEIASHIWYLSSLEMPKKFSGENTKAVVAKARKEAAKKEEAERKKKPKKMHIGRMMIRTLHQEAERKRMEALQRRHENRIAYDEEMKTLSGKAAGPSKITQAAIEANKRAEEERKREEEKERLLKEQRLEAKEGEIEENVNQLEIDSETARTVTEAINILSVGKPIIDRHPEKRLKAAYQLSLRGTNKLFTKQLAFEFGEYFENFQEQKVQRIRRKMLPRLREEYPTYRLSQLKQLLFVCILKYISSDLDIFRFIMVNVWLVEVGTDCTPRSFGLEKSGISWEVLAENIKLCDVKNMENKYTLHVMIRTELDSMPKLQLDNKNCKNVIDEMSRDDFMEDLLKEFPLLKKDRMALIVAKDFILSGAMIMGKQNMEETFLRDHPILVNVIHYWLRGINVPPRMSHSGSSASISDNPTPASGQGGYASIVTPQMLQEAVAQAMRNVGGSRINQGISSSSTSSSQNSHHFPSTLSASSSTQYTAQLAQLADFGFTNTEENRRILEETGGNVEQALELLIALRESIMDLGDTSDS